jgi:hypothetical protein
LPQDANGAVHIVLWVDLLKMFVKNVPAGVAKLDREMRYLE